MVTANEETQAKEFLKRAEIRTMKKDLQALREGDALAERNKITKMQTLEEQLAEQKKRNEAVTIAEASAEEEKTGREEILQRNSGEERLAEKDLKNYATEEERQQIFLLESQRLSFEQQVDLIDKEKDPALKLEKNKLLLQKRDQETKLSSILAQEQKLEDEQKFITGKEQASAIPSEKKGLEQSRWDLDKKIQDIEKKRWEAEKQIEDTDKAIAQVDSSSEKNVSEKNSLRDKILGADKSLREIYSVVMAREEKKRAGRAEEQVAQREALAQSRLEQKEQIQREQWSPNAVKKEEGFLGSIPAPVRKKIIESSAVEEEQRKKFISDVENLSEKPQQEASVEPIISEQPIMPPPPMAPRK